MDWMPNCNQDEFKSVLQNAIKRTAGIAEMTPHHRAKIKNEMSRRHLFGWIGRLTAAVAVGGAHLGPSLLKALDELSSDSMLDVASFLTRATSSELMLSYSHFFNVLVAKQSGEELIRSARQIAATLDREISQDRRISQVSLRTGAAANVFLSAHVHRVRALPHMIAAQQVMHQHGEAAAATADEIFQQGHDETLIEIIAQNLLCGMRPLSPAISIENYRFLEAPLRRLCLAGMSGDSCQEVTPSILCALLNLRQRALLERHDECVRWTVIQCDWIMGRDRENAWAFKAIEAEWGEVVRADKSVKTRTPFIIPEISLLLMQQDDFRKYYGGVYGDRELVAITTIVDILNILRAKTIFKKLTQPTMLEQDYTLARNKIAGFYGSFGFFHRLESILSKRPYYYDLMGSKKVSDFLREMFELGGVRAPMPEKQVDISIDALLGFISPGASAHRWAPLVANDRVSLRVFEKASKERAAGAGMSQVTEPLAQMLGFSYAGSKIGEFVASRSGLLEQYGVAGHASDEEIGIAIQRMARMRERFG